ncbi:MAG: NAD(P)/FAD-dependent oxidoreductase [Nocardioides sp.]|uniref:NAD(P)/FAD-dependent oxidoreductase n=1 Tax=Nocardioides sp. TaxID=35761 RepID=UPI003EFF2C5E
MAIIPGQYDHVIVGGGVASASAVSSIHERAPEASVLVVGAEADAPVYRPDLSKKLWLDDGADAGASVLGLEGAEFRSGVTVERIDPDAHQVALDDGSVLTYGSLLLATGAAPRTSGLRPGPRVIHYRTVADYRALREVAVPGSQVVIVGGGYIGAEMASALAQNDVEVILVISSELVQAGMFPRSVARRVTDTFTAHGVRVVHGRLSGGSVEHDRVLVRLEDGREFTADAAVVGIGVTPRTDLASAAGIVVSDEDGGVVVDDHLRTSAADVYAAGDVASYPDTRLGQRRVEHVDAAESMGAAAGRVMAGGDEAYTHTPFFWSDLFDDGYEAIGELRSDLDVVEDFTDDHAQGVAYYLDGGRVRGVLLWNVWDSVPAAQALIEETADAPLADPAALVGRIPYED